MKAGKKVKKLKKKTVAAVRKKKVKKVVVKKKAAKRRVSPKTASSKTKRSLRTKAIPLVLETVGKITHFFPHVSAGVIKLSRTLKVGDMVQIKGHTTDFKQRVDSIQLEHTPVAEAQKGQEIGLSVRDRVRIGDLVYKL